MVRVGIDLKLFGILVESSKPLTVEQVAHQTGAAPVLLSNTFANSAEIYR